jgi:hypothetical protein
VRDLDGFFPSKSQGECAGQFVFVQSFIDVCGNDCVGRNADLSQKFQAARGRAGKYQLIFHGK